MVKQIHPTDHGNPKQHPYGKTENIFIHTSGKTELWKNEELET